MFQKIRHFLQPFKYKKGLFIFNVFLSFLSALISVYIVIFLKYITAAIENKNWEEVKFYTIVWFCVVSIWFIFQIFYTIPRHKLFWYLDSCIYKDNMNKFFAGNNNEIEKIGTGRIISIIQKGVWSWVLLLWDFVVSVLITIFTSIMIFYSVFSINLYAGIIGIIVLIFSVFWMFFFYPKALLWRIKSNSIAIEKDRINILHIMNKFEIAQNNKEVSETNKIFQKNNEMFNIKIREKIWQGLSYNGVRYLINLILIFTAFYFAYLIFEGKSNLADFVLFTGFATLLGKEINELISLSKKFADNYIYVEKMDEMLEKISEKNDKNE